MPNTHRRRRRDETVELRRVGGVNIRVGSRDPVYNSEANAIGVGYGVTYDAACL